MSNLNVTATVVSAPAITKATKVDVSALAPTHYSSVGWFPTVDCVSGNAWGSVCLTTVEIYWSRRDPMTGCRDLAVGYYNTDCYADGTRESESYSRGANIEVDAKGRPTGRDGGDPRDQATLRRWLRTQPAKRSFATVALGWKAWSAI